MVRTTYVIFMDVELSDGSSLMGGRLQISLRHGFPQLTDLTVSRARVDDFLDWLER